MTPVNMTRFGHGNGNCMQAAVASVLDLPLDEVPNFSDAEERWFIETDEWARSRGLGLIHVGKPESVAFMALHCHAVGLWTVAESENECHAVVMWFESTPNADGTWSWKSPVVHDPHPLGLTLTDLREVIFFVRP